MSYGDYDDSEWSEDEEKPRDPKIDEVKEEILVDLFLKDPDWVFYQRQIEVRYERKFFHWITAKALNELAEEKKTNAAETCNIAMCPGQGVYESPVNRFSQKGV
jgi:hypothetical protein